MNKLTLFLDTIGRSILGELVEENDEFLVIRNPAIINCATDGARVTLQLLPAFFKEFQADKTQPTVWKYRKSLLSASIEEFELDFRFKAQYEQLFNLTASETTEDANVVKLFDK